MGRHRHAVNVRADGLAAVLGPLLRDRAVRAATLVDVDSGMVLDACLGGAAGGAQGEGLAGDLELLGAGHAELVRVALGLLWSGECEVLIGVGGRRHHVARTVPDPHGDRLALAVVVDGPRRAAERTMRRLREVSEAALTAGPSTVRRPVMGAWPLPPTEQRAPLPVPHLPVPGPRPPGGPPPHVGPPPGSAGPGGPAISLFTHGAAALPGPDGATAAVVLGRLAPGTVAVPAPVAAPVTVPAPAGRPEPAADPPVSPGGGAAATGPRPPAPPSALPPAPRAAGQPDAGAADRNTGGRTGVVGNGAAGNGVERPH
jgi:hypothetical protein